MNITQFEERKREHIQHALNPSHQASGMSRLEKIRLVHEALPELDFDEISLKTPCLGRDLSTPFYVAGMTAGHPDAPALNRTLAMACQARGWAMGVGSQRRDLESGGGPLDQWRELRQECPDLVLFANLGISQIITAGISDLRRIVRELGAQALAVHANALQEALQPEGTPQFKDSLGALERLCRELDAPVILKETGCGFSRSTLEKLRGAGLAAVDVSGLGGTHWGRIEGARAQAGSPQATAALTFAGWGESTVDSVLSAALVFGRPARHTAIWASGGVRSGLDATKLVALGASRVGYAQPALAGALAGPEELERWMAQQEYEMKVALFCTGSRSPAELLEKEGAWRAEA